jgi:hypothetical protein
MFGCTIFANRLLDSISNPGVLVARNCHEGAGKHTYILFAALQAQFGKYRGAREDQSFSLEILRQFRSDTGGAILSIHAVVIGASG